MLTLLEGSLQLVDLDTGGLLILSFFTMKGVFGDIFEITREVRLGIWFVEPGKVSNGSRVYRKDRVALFPEVHSEIAEDSSHRL